MSDVFISYKREDAAAAHMLADALKASGHSVWFDENLTSGDAYRHVIRSVIDYCAAVVVIWSKQAVLSEFVLDEATHAKKQGKLCPVRIDNVDLPFGHGQLHADDLTDWEGDRNHPGFIRLLASLNKHVVNARPLHSPAEAKARLQRETAEFKEITANSKATALRGFLKKHPDGPYSNYIRERLAERSSIKFHISRLPFSMRIAMAILVPMLMVAGAYLWVGNEIFRRTGLTASVQFDEPLSEDRLLQLTRQALELAAKGECSDVVMGDPVLSACRDQTTANKIMLNRLGSIVQIKSEGRKRLNGAPGTVFLVKFTNGEMRWAARGGASDKLILFWGG